MKEEIKVNYFYDSRFFPFINGFVYDLLFTLTVSYLISNPGNFIELILKALYHCLLPNPSQGANQKRPFSPSWLVVSTLSGNGSLVFVYGTAVVITLAILQILQIITRCAVQVHPPQVDGAVVDFGSLILTFYDEYFGIEYPQYIVPQPIYLNEFFHRCKNRLNKLRNGCAAYCCWANVGAE